jgi:hypothetical protein
LYKNAGRVFLDHFFKVLGIILVAIMVKTRQKKTPVATGRVCNFVYGAPTTSTCASVLGSSRVMTTMMMVVYYFSLEENAIA